jgi:hypothetical protein
MRAPCLLLLAGTCLAQTPRISADALAWNFGKLSQGDQAYHAFILTNEGSGPLRILELNPSCGCTSAIAGKRELAPGERTEIRVTLHAQGLKGKVAKGVDVVSDDPVTPHLNLALQAEVESDVLVASDTLTFLDLGPRDHLKASLKLESGTPHPIYVADADLSEAPWLGVATRTVGKDLLVDFELMASKLPPAQAAGEDTVVLHLLNPNPSQVTLRVHWEKRRPVTATPAVIAWRRKAGQELIATVEVRDRKRRPFKILSALTTSSLLVVPDLPRKAAPVQKIRIVMSVRAQARTYQEKVILSLDLPDQPLLEIRVAADLE